MTGGRRIIALDNAAADDDPAAPDPARLPINADDRDLAREEAGEAALAPRGTLRWVVPGIAAALIAGWTALFARARIDGWHSAATPAALVELISQWALPVLLVLVCVAIARTTLRDASRHAAVIRALGDESRLLEARLRAMNTELSLARDFIAAQSRDLESLGRVTVDRLSGSAERMKDLVTDQGKAIDHIGVVAAKALDNISTLRTHLPVISNSAKDAANAIALAGRSADTQVDSLIAGFNRLNEFGVASARKVDDVRGAVDAALDAFAGATERIAEAGEVRLRAVIDALNEQRARIDSQEAAMLAANHAVEAGLATQRQALGSALAANAAQIAAQLEAIDAAISQRRAGMAAAAAAAADTIDQRLSRIDDAIDAQRQRQIAAIDRLSATCDALAARIAALGTTIDASTEVGTRTADAVDAAMTRLTARLTAAREALGGTDTTIVALTDAAVRLLELIEAAGNHTRTRLPDALRSAMAGIDNVEQRVVGLCDGLTAAGAAGTALAGTIDQADTRLGAMRSAIAAVHDAIIARAADHDQRLATMRDSLRAAHADSDALSGAIERRLAGAVAELTTAAQTAGAHLGETTAAEISAMAARFGDETSAALAQVIQGRGAQMIARLEQAMDSAADAARETASHMRDQLAQIDDLAGNLESRISHLRERAEDQVDNDFARRTALITESLNSAAIDITRILSAEVSEAAWASYLRGERGIFTRRAVSLLDTAEARTVQQHYETDAEFRMHVNRYIHDFEAMLRQLLATRDGNALGVTVLSSDMGKLYVALAQGIERLRA